MWDSHQQLDSTRYKGDTEQAPRDRRVAKHTETSAAVWGLKGGVVILPRKVADGELAILNVKGNFITINL